MNEVHWIPIWGDIKIDNSIMALSSIPLPPNEQYPTGQPPYSFIRSNIEFEKGTISLEFYMENKEAACLIGLNMGQPIELYAGINAAGSKYGFSILANSQWEFKTGSGFGSSLAIKQWHKLKIVVKGSLLDLYIDDVKVSSFNYIISRSSIGLFLQGNGELKVKNIKVDAAKPVCFVVMQFTDEYNVLYADVIKPTCESYGYEVIRADDYYTSGLIIDDITMSINESTLIIADITPDNPNVFYEVGYAHGVGKATILLSDRKREKLPFDLSGFRTLFYDNTIGGKNIVEERLRKHLSAIVY